MIIIHPTHPGVSKNVPDSEADGWLESGWLPAGSPEALAAAPEVEVSRVIGAPAVEGVRGPNTEPRSDAATEPCPTCGAVGDAPCVTASGNETSRHAKRA